MGSCDCANIQEGVCTRSELTIASVEIDGVGSQQARRCFTIYSLVTSEMANSYQGFGGLKWIQPRSLECRSKNDPDSNQPQGITRAYSLLTDAKAT